MDEFTEWIPCSHRLPMRDGKYLVTEKNFSWSRRTVSVQYFTNDAYKMDKYDFAEYKGKKKKLFYSYDSEWGYREIDDVVAWMELPEAYEGM